MTSRVSRAFDILKENGLSDLCTRSRVFGLIPLRNTISSRYPIGTNIFSRDWDLLIILDACRTDALQQINVPFDSLDTSGSIKSVGSTSAEWILKSFTDEYQTEISQTACVTANGWYKKVFYDRIYEEYDSNYRNMYRGRPDWRPISAATEFEHYEYISADDDYEPLHPMSKQMPHVVTDRAIATARTVNPERLIVHYMFPHTPFVADAIDWSPSEMSQRELIRGPTSLRDLNPEEKVHYTQARQGEVSAEKVRELYHQNLRFVLDYVKVLLHNVSAETAVISADHGEMLGEFGLWGHPFGNPLDQVKTVPWAVTTATDEATYEPEYAPPKDSTEDTTEAFLKNMGYI